MKNTKAKKILFTSGKGGVGKSTLSTTFAKLLCEQDKKVLMIDFDASLRTLDIMLSVSNVVLYDWGDVLNANCDSLDALITTSGPKLLAAPLEKVELTKERIRRLISYYEDRFDYIILDCPAGVGEIFDLTLHIADIAIIISTPDLVCVRSAAVAGRKAKDAGVEARLLINRFKKIIMANGKALNIDEVIDATGIQLIGVIPEDLQLSLSILNGELLDPSTRGVRAMTRVVRRLNGEQVPLKI
ncbi:MAG: septum site-determining protein MinD [Ruminococcaceae bacterium]|nr:septum site-determining protein MinD [Oscillospiraceae bacterium]